jgi:hypothetical protein
MGSATLVDGDYLAAGGVLTFLPGETAQTIAVTVNGDTTFELDETLTVTVSSPTNATIPPGAEIGTGTITNDDGEPTVTLSLTGSPFSENGGVATATATLSNPSAFPVTVDLGFTGTAAAGEYSASGTSIVIPPLSTSGSITLTGLDDVDDENDEAVVVDVVGVKGGTEDGDQQVTATISDDDLPVAVDDSYSVLEDQLLTVPPPGVLANDNAAPGSVALATGSGLSNGQFAPVLLGSGRFSYQPNSDFNGTDSFQYQVRNLDGEMSAAATVTITVIPVNDAPTFTAGPDQVLPRVAGAQTVPGWTTGMSAGPADEAGQTLNFIVTTDNAALFSVAPAIDPTTGTLTFTPAPFVFGTATVSVTLMDDCGTANGGSDTSAIQTFTITVHKHLIESRAVSQNEVDQFAAGAGAGGPGTVTVFNGDGTTADTEASDGSSFRSVLTETSDGSSFRSPITTTSASGSAASNWSSWVRTILATAAG